jgi:hypothetical protein
MRIGLLLLALLIPALPASAEPPSVHGFQRGDPLEQRMQERRRELLAEEEFARKPWHEKLVIRYAEGAASFDGRKLSDTFVVRQFLGWKEIRNDAPDPESVRVAMLLPEALRLRLVASKPLPKASRFEASRPLVEALTSRYRALRDLAIACLRALYGTELFYEADASASDRVKMQRAWAKEIRKRRR